METNEENTLKNIYEHITFRIKPRRRGEQGGKKKEQV